MKICCTCKKELSEESFCKNASTPDGLHRNCRQCKAAQSKRERAKNKDRIAQTNKRYYDANLDKIRRADREYYLKNKDQIKTKVNVWIGNNREKHNRYSTKAKNKIKQTVFEHYSNNDVKCKCCGEKEIGILTIDHIAGNGAEHRREIGLGCRGGYNFYRWLKRNNYPEGFQVLCYNCQFRKRMIEMRPENPTATQETRARYARSVKVQCLKEYGGCKCKCGEKDMDVLTLDHVNDDGADHRKETGTR